MVHTCKNSGLTTVEWCRQNDIGIKTYYYRYTESQGISIGKLMLFENHVNGESQAP